MGKERLPYEPTITVKTSGGVRTVRIARIDELRLLDSADILEAIAAEIGQSTVVGTLCDIAQQLRDCVDTFSKTRPIAAPEQTDATT